MTLLPSIAFTLALGIALTMSAPGASASQTVWRCEGNSYSSQPCTGGRLVDAADTRSTEDQRAAREVVERDRRLAREMAQDRRERERDLRQTVGTGMTGFGLPKPAAADAIKPRDRKAGKAKQRPARTARAPKQVPTPTPSGAGT